jgi:hypothetical protein
MTQFSTKGHEVQTNDYVSAFIKPGIVVAKVESVGYHKSQGGTEGLKFTHAGKPMEELEGKSQKAESTMWTSPKAWPYTLDRLCIMADQLGVREQLDAVSANSAEEYAEACNAIFAGKVARWKFSGTEIEGKFDEAKGEKKNNWFKAELAQYDFVEPMTVEEENTKLKFDKTDKWDMKMLEKSDIEVPTGANDPLGAPEEEWG